MTHKPWHYPIGRALLLPMALWLSTTSIAHGQAARPKFKAGEIILYCYPGTARAKVDALAASVKAELRPLLMADCYVLTLPVDKKTDKDTLDSVALLKADAKVRWVGASRIHYRDQTRVEPNDPRYKSGEQWNLKQMNLPQAWALQKGSSKVTVAVIDSGFRPNHEDLKGQYSDGSFDEADNDSDITADGSGAAGEAEHGVHVSGIIVAKADNSKGIAGICWENIKCLALKIQKKGTANLDTPAILNSFTYLATNKDKYNIAVCNMSFGGYGDPNDANDPEYVAVKACVDKGIIMMASAGNDYPVDNTTHLPSGYPFVTSVGSVGPSGKHAYYSSTGKVDIAAPGGEMYSDNDPNGVLSTLGSDTGYAYEQGTSMASPDATGVMGLLMSVPGITPTRAVAAMKNTANRAGLGLGTLPDATYGYGVVDAYKALASVSVNAVIVEPVGVDAQGNTNDPTGTTPPIETFKPTIRIKVNLVALDNLTVTIDGVQQNNLAQYVESGTATGDTPQYVLAFRKQFSTEAPYTHTIVVSGTNPSNGISTTDTRTITIQPKVVQGYSLTDTTGKTRNIAMVSIPYIEDATDSPTGNVRELTQLFSTDTTFFRYIYKIAQDANGTPLVLGDYAKFGPGAPDPYADSARLRPPDIVSSALDSGTAGAVTDVRPLGVAWFADLPTAVTIATNGKPINQPVRVPLHDGWNMIGDPYTYPVAFNTALVEVANGTRVPIQQAVDQHLVLPFLYRFIGGDYQFQALPAGTLLPWEGHWIYVVPQNNTVTLNRKMALIFTPSPTSATRSAAVNASSWNNSAPSVNGPGSWALRLEAHAKNLSDTNNYIGMTTINGNAASRTRVPKPPKPAPYVSLGVAQADTTGGIFAQDLQTLGGVKSWDVAVNTDQANTDVKLAWPAARTLPRNYRLTLTDKVSGQIIDMRQQNTYTFNSGRNASTRSFVITARPANQGGRALLTNIVVNQSAGRSTDGRAVSTYEIGYNLSQDARVEVSILSFNGRALATVGATRAAASGENRVVWNGRDNVGRSLPAGPYALQLRAITTEGEVTREIRPFTITR